MITVAQTSDQFSQAGGIDHADTREVDHQAPVTKLVEGIVDRALQLAAAGHNQIADDEQQLIAAGFERGLEST